MVNTITADARWNDSSYLQVQVQVQVLFSDNLQHNIDTHAPAGYKANLGRFLFE